MAAVVTNNNILWLAFIKIKENTPNFDDLFIQSW